MIESFLGFPVAKIGGFPYGEWSTEPPTQSGWYWIRNGWPQSFVAWVEAYESGIVSVGHVGALWSVSDITHWLGPIPEPEKPGGLEK